MDVINITNQSKSLLMHLKLYTFYTMFGSPNHNLYSLLLYKYTLINTVNLKVSKLNLIDYYITNYYQISTIKK